MQDNDPNRLPQPLPVTNRETYLDRLNHYLALTLSLPERSARALSALVGGGTLLLSKTLIPTAIKDTNSYRFTLGMFQTFLIKNVAGIEQIPAELELKDRFVHRKLVGTSLEAAGLLTMHLSPVWVFAIASDAARGGHVFLQRLVQHLKENAVIDADSNPQSLEQILLSIHEMGSQGATAIDTPPLSLQEVRELADELRRSTALLAENSRNLLPTFESIWDQINLVARKENLSREQILGVLSIRAAQLTQAGRGTAGAVTSTGYYFLDEIILTEYRDTLSRIAKTGALPYMREHMAPFLQSAQQHFNMSRETATQRWFKNAISRFAHKLRSGK